MNLRQLSYFIKIIEAQSMTKAAEQLHVAQPALSQQIKLLESSLGVTLLNRNARGISPTQEGEALYRHARTILRHVDNTRAILSLHKGPVFGTASVAMASSTARILALPLIDAICETYPSIMLEIMDLPSADLIPALQKGRVDFAIAPDVQQHREIRMTPVFQEEMFLMIKPGRWTLTDPLRLKDVSQLPLLLPSQPNTLRSLIDTALHQAGLHAQLLAEASTSAIMVPAVKAGRAATILPFSAAHEEIQSGAIAIHSITPRFTRTMFLCRDSTQYSSEVGDIVQDLCLQVIRQLIDHNEWHGCVRLPSVSG